MKGELAKAKVYRINFRERKTIVFSFKSTQQLFKDLFGMNNN